MDNHPLESIVVIAGHNDTLLFVYMYSLVNNVMIYVFVHEIKSELMIQI